MSQTIEFVHDRYWLCQRGIYGQDSVLAGQEFRQLLRPYDTLEQATSENPEAVVDLQGTRPEVHIPVNPPAWFDPSYAGESWDEE